MFRISAALALAVVLLSGCRVQAFEPPAATGPTSLDQGFRGHVKSVRVEESSIEGAPRTLAERSVFDRSGRLLKYAQATNAASERISYTVSRYIYDPNGHINGEDMFEVRSLRKGAKPTYLQHHTYKFDSKGRCIEEQTIDNQGKSYGSTIYEYDSQGNPTRETGYSSAGQIKSVEERKYGPDHRLLIENTRENRSSQGSLFDYRWSREHRYDAQGNQTDMFSYQQGVPEAHWVWTYGERRRLTSSQVIVSDPAKDQHLYGFCGDCGLSSGKGTYKYDNSDRIIEERAFQPGDELVRLNRYSYDDHGNRTREWVYKFGPPQASRQKTIEKLDGIEQAPTWNNGLPTNTFSYDSHGNWIKKVSTRETGSLDAKAPITSIAYRVIE